MEGLDQVFGSSYNPGSTQLDQPRNELGQEDFFRLMVAQLNNQAMLAAQLIGREVLTEAGPVLDTFYTPGEEVRGGIVAENPTEDARVTIYDGSGNLINSIALGDIEAGSHQFSWNGAVKGGGEAELGKYLVVAEGWVDGGLTSLSMQQYRKVTSVSVDRQNTSVLLQLENGEDVKFSQVNEFK